MSHQYREKPTLPSIPPSQEARDDATLTQPDHQMGFTPTIYTTIITKLPFLISQQLLNHNISTKAEPPAGENISHAVLLEQSTATNLPSMPPVLQADGGELPLVG
jgi:hypothetical protein